jgi:hypothetical protein
VDKSDATSKRFIRRRTHVRRFFFDWSSQRWIERLLSIRRAAIAFFGVSAPLASET